MAGAPGRAGFLRCARPQTVDGFFRNVHSSKSDRPYFQSVVIASAGWYEPIPFCQVEKASRHVSPVVVVVRLDACQSGFDERLEGFFRGSEALRSIRPFGMRPGSNATGSADDLNRLLRRQFFA